MAKSKTVQDNAFGIVPIFQQHGTYFFLLIQHHAGHWGFPKGHANPGESSQQAACRELVEETGVSDYRLLADFSWSEQYTFFHSGQRFEKTVVYFPALVQSTTVKCQQEEIRAYAWLAFEEAIAKLTFDGAKQVLKQVHQYLLSHLLS